MTFSVLCAVCLAGLLGPLLAWPRRWRLPVVLGPLLAGLIFGATGFRLLHSNDTVFTFLANIGFALVMFVAGSHVPVRDPAIGAAIRVGLARAVVVGIIAAGLAFGIATAFDTRHAPLYAVLMASSSAAFVLPVIDSLKLAGSDVVALLPQVAIADGVCIVALPLAIDPGHAGRAALGAVGVIAAAALFFVLFREVERRGWRHRVHRISEHRQFALELRISLVILFGLAALAAKGHVSIMLAGFSMGLAVAGVGEPRRLAHQLFALTDGFFGPLFFVWLGALLDLRALGDSPRFIAIGVLLGLGSVAAHVAMRGIGQPISLGMLAAAQLGLPLAAATIGTQLGVISPALAAALLLSALVTIAFAVGGSATAARAGGKANMAQAAAAEHTGIEHTGTEHTDDADKP